MIPALNAYGDKAFGSTRTRGDDSIQCYDNCYVLQKYPHMRGWFYLEMVGTVVINVVSEHTRMTHKADLIR